VEPALVSSSAALYVYVVVELVVLALVRLPAAS
jgi:hypothetical protein